MYLDVVACGCKDPDNCACPADGGGCMNGFCFCPQDGRLEFENRRCHPAYDRTETLSPSECPIACHCGCRPSEICGSDGRCYCPDGSLVVPVVDENQELIGHNQTCPPKPLEFDHNRNHSVSLNFSLSSLGVQSPVQTLTPSSTSSPSSFLVVIAVTSVALAVVVMIAGIFTIIFYQRVKKQLRKHQAFRSPIDSRSSLALSSSTSPAAPHNDPVRIAMESMMMRENDLYESAHLLSVDTLSLIGSKAVEQSRIKISDQIGQGNFGKVYKGIFTKPNGESIDVAVKIPRLEGRPKEYLRDFVLEAQITTTFDHVNILSCLGISADSSGTPWLLFEFMPYGDLAEVLRSNSGVFMLQRDDLPTLKMADLWWLSLQIARGMKYLADRHFTHRDLAARNCLLGHNLQLKISDFGLTRDVYTNEYYQMGEQRMLPIRWMAPESIQFGKFSSKSDVWSFGVVLWEIFTFGKRPYYSYSNQEVATLVPGGEASLRAPENCPELIRQIMMSCWKTEPCQRTTFDDIIEKLEEVSKLFFHANPAYGEVPSSFPGDQEEMELLGDIDNTTQDDQLNNLAEDKYLKVEQ